MKKVKKLMKLGAAVLVVLAMCVGLLPVTAFAGPSSDKFTCVCGASFDNNGNGNENGLKHHQQTCPEYLKSIGGELPVDPDKPGTEDPDKPGTEDPDKPGTEDPDKPGTEDPDKPGTEDPEGPGQPAIPPVTPVTPPEVEIDGPDVPLGGLPELDGAGGEVELEDVAVPLAGLVTRAELVSYLWVQAGRPEAEPSTFTDVDGHECFDAISWAQANGVAKGMTEELFAPDELVTVGQAKLFLERYARHADMEAPEPAALAGKADDEILDNADEVLAQFFGKTDEIPDGGSAA